MASERSEEISGRFWCNFLGFEFDCTLVEWHLQCAANLGGWAGIKDSVQGVCTACVNKQVGEA